MGTPKNRHLVLVGGGGCGRAQKAALKALDEVGLLTGLAGIVGTSVGGMNACALAVGLAQGKGTAILEEAWAKVTDNASVYTPDLAAAIAHPWLHPFDDAAMTHRFFFGPAACSTEPLADLVKSIMGDWTTEKLAAAGAPALFVRAVSPDGQRAVTLQGDLDAMALATSAIPAVFPPRWGYTDGGAVDNEPVDVALANGAQQLIVVFCGPEKPASSASAEPVTLRRTDAPPVPITGLQNLLRLAAGITQRGEDLADQAAARAEAQGVQVVWCYPRHDTGSALDFSPRNLEELGAEAGALAVADAKALGWIG